MKFLKKSPLVYLYLVLLLAGLAQGILVSNVEIKVNGTSAERMRVGDKLTVEWDLSAPGRPSEIAFYVDLNKNRVYDTNDISFADLRVQVMDGVYDEEEGGDADRTVNGQIVWNFSVDFYLPGHILLVVVTEIDTTTGYDWVEVENVVSDYSVSGTVFPEKENLFVMAGFNYSTYYFSLTDVEGKYKIILPAEAIPPTRECNVAVYANEYPSKTLLIDGHLEGIDFIPTSYGQIRGKVYVEGNTVPPREVEVIARDENNFEISYRTETDLATGNFILTLPNGKYYVSVSDLFGYFNAERKKITIQDNIHREVNFMLNPLDVRIYGCVMDKETRQGLGGVELGFGKRRGNGLITIFSTRTDSNGNYSIYLCDGEYEISFRGLPSGYKPAEIIFTVANGEERELNIELEKYSFTGEIRGKVTDEKNNPLAGIQVEAREEFDDQVFFAETNSQGEYTIKVINGEYFLSLPRVDVFEFLTVEEPDPVGVEDNVVEDCNFVLNPCNCRLYGKFTPRELLVEGIKIKATMKLSDEAGSSTSSVGSNRKFFEKNGTPEGVWITFGYNVSPATGLYTISLPDGEWEVIVEIPENSGLEGPDPIQITLAEEEEREYNVVLREIAQISLSQTNLVPPELPYPNPFNPECYIPVGKVGDENLRSSQKVKIYNILGQLVREIDCSKCSSRWNSSRVYWDGRDSRGLEVPAGVYFYEVADESVRKMVVLR